MSRWSELLAEIADSRFAIDRDSNILFGFFRRVVTLRPRLNNQELEDLYGRSPALAFTLWQHLAAAERLASIDKNGWPDILHGREFCGLATTHLAHPDGSRIKATLNNGNYVLSGKTDWVCGFHLFQKIIVGFAYQDEIIFALVKYPNAKDSQIQQSEMICLNGTNTVAITWDGFIVVSADIISRRPLVQTAKPRSSQYMVPEVGIGKYALDVVKQRVSGLGTAKIERISAKRAEVESILQQLESERRSGQDLGVVYLLRDRFNQKAVELMAQLEGSGVMYAPSLVAQMRLELMFVDCLWRPPHHLQGPTKS